MSFSTAKFVWKNGEIIPWEQATVHLSVHALHYGTGVFEGIRCYNTDRGPAIFRLPEHMERLHASARIHSMPIPYDVETLNQATLDTIRANDLSSAYIRPLAYFGSGSLSLQPRNCPVEVAIMAWEWGALLGEESLERGIRATISSWRKFDSESMPSQAKACGQYINSVLAAREAQARGFDEALLLNSAGVLAEGSGENIFVVKNGVIATNGLAGDPILLGITRATIMELARERGFAIEVRSLSRVDLMAADEIFITGTAAEVVPIREIDGFAIGTGNWPVTSELQKAYRDVVLGRDPRHLDWLAFVNEPKAVHTAA